MKKIFKIFSLTEYIRTLIVLILISLPVIGTDCEKTVFSGDPGSIEGAWRLVYNSGSNHDICPGEVIIFDNNGLANLKCPNQNAVVRHYTISGSDLTYTETGVSYRIESLTSNQLQLSGNNRFLYYDKTSISDDKNTGSESPGRNSSEK